jgi:putative Mg2+ transporter-C (MgtC) family protein
MISYGDILIRLVVAALLGSLVGFERERLLWAAGIRTHMLVAVGACLVMIVSAYGFQHAIQMPHVILDPSRMAAQVVSGIGFLGAGSILLRNHVVRGLTTAASIWAVAAVGLAAGGGLFFAAAPGERLSRAYPELHPEGAVRTWRGDARRGEDDPARARRADSARDHGARRGRDGRYHDPPRARLAARYPRRGGPDARRARRPYHRSDPKAAPRPGFRELSARHSRRRISPS